MSVEIIDLKLNNESSEIDAELMLWSGRSIIVIIIVDFSNAGCKRSENLLKMLITASGMLWPV